MSQLDDFTVSGDGVIVRPGDEVSVFVRLYGGTGWHTAPVVRIVRDDEGRPLLDVGLDYRVLAGDAWVDRDAERIG
jgi:hypothetical protein